MNWKAEEIKEKISMDDVLRRYGMDKSRSGFIVCPFHGEKTASCKIYPNGYYCFGCGEGGDTIHFVKKLFSVDFGGALKRLEQDFGISVSDGKEEEPLFLRRRRERKRQERFLKERYNSLSKEYRGLWAVSDGLTDEQKARMDYLEYVLEELRKELARNGW